MKYVCAIALCMVAGRAHALDMAAINQQREGWVLKAREGQLNQAEQGLKLLFEQTKDIKVRDDLIAIMFRSGHRRELLALCDNCNLKEFSSDSIELLARAARDEGLYKQAILYYSTLQERQPPNKNAWLGLMLTQVDAHLFAHADQVAAEYEAKFGMDKGLLDARQYLQTSRVSNVEKLHVAQESIKAQTLTDAQVLQVFKAASSLGSMPSPPLEELVNQNPHLFKPVDKLWLAHSKASLLIRTGMQTEDKANWQTALQLLNQIIETAPKTHDLARLARQDRVVLLVQLRSFEAAEKGVQELLQMGVKLPNYVLEAHADALLGLERAKDAIIIYEPLFAQQKSNALRQKLLMAYSEAEEYGKAQKLMDAWIEKPYKNDFTQTQQTKNGEYEQWVYWKVKLRAWRGDLKGAEQQLKVWNEAAPANPWSQILYGNIQRWKGQPDAAEQIYTAASPWLPPAQRYITDVEVAHAKLDKDDIASANQIINSLPDDKANVKILKERLALTTAAELSMSYQAVRTNEAVNATQANQEQTYAIRWLSKANQKGHRVFAQYQRQYNELTTGNLHADYVGIGTALNFYPLSLSLETGLAHQSRNRPYFRTKAQYRLNDHWQFGTLIDLNSSETPLKALADGDTANQINLSASYRPTHLFSTGASLSAMRFTDGNLRRSASLWANQVLVQHDRWRLAATARMAASKNRVLNVSYYNPASDRSAELELSASYRMPVQGGRSVKHELNGSIGEYKQSSFDKEATWRLAYRQEWRLSRRLNVYGELGRQRAIYDGQAEYKNFGALNLQWKLD